MHHRSGIGVPCHQEKRRDWRSVVKGIGALYGEIVGVDQEYLTQER